MPVQFTKSGLHYLTSFGVSGRSLQGNQKWSPNPVISVPSAGISMEDRVYFC